MFINMPHLGLTVSQIDSVNANCEPVNSTSVDGFLSTVFPNLTHIVPEADIGIGLSAQVGVEIEDFKQQVALTHTLAGTSFSLPTACLMWDGKSNAFTTPTTTSSTAGPTATGDGGPGRKTNTGPRGVNNPIPELRGVGLVFGMLLSVLFVAISL